MRWTPHGPGDWLKGMEPNSDRPSNPFADRRGLGAALGIVAVVALLVGVFLFIQRDDEPDSSEVAAGGSTTTVTDDATTTTDGPTTTARTTTTSADDGGLDDAEQRLVVWPAPGEETFDDPVDAATSFATDLAGFVKPRIGEFRAGDSRSGEVEVRAERDQQVTTVLVRRLGDDNWYVIGATTPNIVLDTPSPGAAVSDPVELAGRARAFEGNVQVSVFTRGDDDPIGEGFVTGSGGGELGPFEGEVEFDDPGEGFGVVLLYVSSARDGVVTEAVAVPVRFG